MTKKVGILHSGHKQIARPQTEALKSIVSEGYQADETQFVERYGDDGDIKNLRSLARQLLKDEKVDVLVAAGGSRSCDAAKHESIAAQKTPRKRTSVVFTSIADQVRPDQHMTGICARTSECDPTRLELLMELCPTAKTIGVLTNSSRSNFSEKFKAVQDAAKALGVKLTKADATKPQEIDPAFKKFKKIDALLVTADPLFNDMRSEIVKCANTLKNTPAIYQWKEFATAGGLMSYGPDLTEAYELAGRYVVSLLEGLSPLDLPIVLLTKFELVINLTTVEDMDDFTVPDTLLVRAEFIGG